eukprot:CAMPEP_0180656528 /NCGR_PEP_ID=MMETSP1037_2-20121125/55907_1 /TAXON_ID=632150 /ORGANISM="Azadinium spinosum, Strain 3D9" /LENGTH=75 /DNA_ID=CAMNT_0022683131 /DNA_START=18 /DNA_END=242 /DNA_ORIENTATION=+
MPVQWPGAGSLQSSDSTETTLSDVLQRSEELIAEILRQSGGEATRGSSSPAWTPLVDVEEHPGLRRAPHDEGSLV